MNFTQDELKQLQAINSLKENELGTRMPTEQEFQAFNATIQELWEKGFAVSQDNFLKLWLAFDANPNIPITRLNILETTKVYRDNYDWKSAAEVEFRKLSDQLGTTTTDLVIRLLGHHGLVNTAGTEELFNNFNQVVGFYQTRGWTISVDSFEKAIGNLRTSLKHGALFYKPTPTELARQKRWEDTRNSEPNTEYKNFTKTTKSALQIAQEKAATVAHIMNPDGTRMSDQIMREFYEAHPEEIEVPKTPAISTPVDTDEAFYHKQTKDYIRSIASNLIRAEAEKEYGHQHNASWKATFFLLRNWYERRAPGAPQR